MTGERFCGFGLSTPNTWIPKASWRFGAKVCWPKKSSLEKPGVIETIPN
jgi:hypothetical protein